MSNLSAHDQLKSNLWRFIRLWRYASHRGLSFALRYQRKALACAQALDIDTITFHDLAYCHDAVFQGD